LTLRTALPEFFDGWDPMSPENQAILSLGWFWFCVLVSERQTFQILKSNLIFFFSWNRGFLPLPGYDHLGRKVIFGRIGAIDPNIFKVFL
jgi:hypothetical protein